MAPGDRSCPLGSPSSDLDVWYLTPPRKIHDRMPAIIDPKDHQRWFDGGDDLLVPYPAEKMSVIPA
jgi:hypothetical protein